jgi:peptidoglycan-associated lipoprotein
MHVTSDRSRKLAAMMFAALMLQACDTTNDTQTATKVDTPATGIVDPNGTTQVSALDPDHQWQTEVGNTIEFATDAYDLSPAAQAVLQRQAQWLLQYPARTAVVEGHADERGTREYNLALGERRAQSAQAYLIALGIDASRLQTTSFGKEQPLCGEAEDACWQRNRRAVTALNP